MIRRLSQLSWLTIAEFLVLLWLAIDIHATKRTIIENRAIIIELTGKNEKLILDFMSRTVDRWDKLQNDNPEIKVPRIIEPLEKPHLTEREMERR